MSEKTEEEIRKGKRAELLLDDDLLNEALDTLSANALRAMETCHSDELIERRADWAMAEKFRRTLHAYLDAAKIALKSIET